MRRLRRRSWTSCRDCHKSHCHWASCWPVLDCMERRLGCSHARPRRQHALECGELVVDGDPQRLQRPANRHLHSGLRQIRQRCVEPKAHEACEGVRRLREFAFQRSTSATMIGRWLFTATTLVFRRSCAARSRHGLDRFRALDPESSQSWHRRRPWPWPASGRPGPDHHDRL